MHQTFIIASIFNVPLQTKTAFTSPLRRVSCGNVVDIITLYLKNTDATFSGHMSYSTGFVGHSVHLRVCHQFSRYLTIESHGKAVGVVYLPSHQKQNKKLSVSDPLEQYVPATLRGLHWFSSASYSIQCVNVRQSQCGAQSVLSVRVSVARSLCCPSELVWCAVCAVRQSQCGAQSVLSAVANKMCPKSELPSSSSMNTSL